MIRVVGWNIQQGGGARAEAICQTLSQIEPDVCVLVEFRASQASQKIRQHLAKALKLRHSLPRSNRPEAYQPDLLVASRLPLEACRIPLRAASPEVARLAASRWLPCLVGKAHKFLLGAVHVPNRRQPTGTPATVKREFLRALVAVARKAGEQPGLIIGDFNTGRRGQDEEHPEAPVFDLPEDQFMVDMDQVWKDAFWCGPRLAVEYSWLNKGSQRHFRIDHAFVHPALLPSLRCYYLENYDYSASDHRPLIVEFDLA